MDPWCPPLVTAGDAVDEARIFARCAGEADIISENAGASEAASGPTPPARNAGGVWSISDVSSDSSVRAERILTSAAGVALNMSFTGVFDIGSDGRAEAGSRKSERSDRVSSEELSEPQDQCEQHARGLFFESSQLSVGGIKNQCRRSTAPAVHHSAPRFPSAAPFNSPDSTPVGLVVSMPPKKQKTTHAGAGARASNLSALDPSVFSPDNLQNAATRYASAQPFPHGVVTQLCDDASLRLVQQEMRVHLTATFKETDLFKVLQTGDLATIDSVNPEIVPKIPNLLKLRQAIYSPEFREMVQNMTGCAPLTDRIDCSANVYPRSGHLLCHDDVIGTRCISYIIYLTDPDDGWVEEDGGALELYPVEEVPGAPGCTQPGMVPSTNLLPKWNSMAFFTVAPGKSFHAVQEVFCADKPRLSISGWYHAADAPVGSEHATLSQLKSNTLDDDITEFTPFPSAIAAVVAAAQEASTDAADENEKDDDEPLGPDADDLEFLARWVNPEYLDPSNVAQIREKMEEDSSVQLREFLLPELAQCIRDATRRADKNDKLGNGKVPSHSAGVRDGWRAVGPTHKQKLMLYETNRVRVLEVSSALAGAFENKKQESVKGKGKAPVDGKANMYSSDFLTSLRDQPPGVLLKAVAYDLFRSEPFARLLTSLTGLRPTAHKCDVRRFRPGLDYTVAHAGIMTTDPRLDATFCVVDDESDLNQSAWDFGEVGGFECYIAADEQGDAATDEVYNAQGDAEEEDELLSVSATFNTLSLVHRDEGIMRFVKYVSHLAPSSRWDIAAQYTVEGVADSDDEDDDEEEEER